MGGMGARVITSKRWPSVHQDGIDIDRLNGNQDLFMPKEYGLLLVKQKEHGLQEAGAGADIVARGRHRLDKERAERAALTANSSSRGESGRMGGMGEAVIMSKSLPTVDQDGLDIRNGNHDLVLLKEYRLQEDGAGADVVAGERRRLAMREASHTENSLRATAFKHDNDKKETIGSLLRTLSVIFVLCWTDIKFAFGQTDYGCTVVADPVAEKTSSNSFMVAITLLAIIGGAVGVAFWVSSHRRNSHRRNPMDVIDEALKDAPSMLRNDPNLEILPAIEPWSGME